MSDHTPQPKFWLEEPSALFSSWTLFPNESMNRDEKLNALTRLSLAISLGLYLLKYPYWATFLLVTLAGIIAIKYSCRPEHKEGFSIPPTYPGVNYQETVLAPTFAEEWQVPPVEYDLVDEVYDPEEGYEGLAGTYGPNRKMIGQNTPAKEGYGTDDGQRYVRLGDMGRYKDPLELDPYGQYLTVTNQLPGDQNYIRRQGTLSTARAYANDAFRRHKDAFQEDMERIHKKKIARRFSSNLYTVSSAYTGQA